MDIWAPQGLSGSLLWFIDRHREGDVPQPVPLVSWKAVSSRLYVAILSATWRGPMLRRSQEQASRAEGWREGTALVSSLEHWLHQPRLPWSHPENPPLGWYLAARAVTTLLRLLLTWSDFDSVICSWKRCASNHLRCARQLSRHLPLCISLNPHGIPRSERISFLFYRGSERSENSPMFLWPLHSQTF